jgi:hypothetical protein
VSRLLRTGSPPRIGASNLRAQQTDAHVLPGVLITEQYSCGGVMLTMEHPEVTQG